MLQHASRAQLQRQLERESLTSSEDEEGPRGNRGGFEDSS